MTIDGTEIQKRFWPHELTVEQKAEVELLRIRFEDLAVDILGRSPKSREQSLAMTKLEEAAFWAVAAIARNG